MKVFTLLVFLLLSACATKKVEAPWLNDLIGFRGYFTAPPQMIFKSGYSKTDEFKPCLYFEVTGVHKNAATDSYALEIFQNGKRFLTESIGGRYVFQYNEIGKYEVALGEEEVIDPWKGYISKKHPVKNRKVTIWNIQTTARTFICKERSPFVGMTEKELVFINGYPIEIIEQASQITARKQYVYPKNPRSVKKKTYYLFTDGKLESWRSE